jgi:hypothetical protein
MKWETKGDALHIDGKRVLKGWESFSGWYWFGTERAFQQDTVLNGHEYENDQIWFGLVQGHEEEWGYWSEGELESLRPRVWEIPARDLPYAGRRA